MNRKHFNQFLGRDQMLQGTRKMTQLRQKQRTLRMELEILKTKGNLGWERLQRMIDLRIK